MKITYRLEGSVLIVTINGVFAGEEARTLCQKLKRALERSPRHLDLLFDLTGVETLDSGAISRLVTIYVEAKKIDPRIEIAIVLQRDRVRRLLEFARMANLFYWFDDVNAALDFLKKPLQDRKRLARPGQAPPARR